MTSEPTELPTGIVAVPLTSNTRELLGHILSLLEVTHIGLRLHDGRVLAVASLRNSAPISAQNDDAEEACADLLARLLVQREGLHRQPRVEQGKRAS